MSIQLLGMKHLSDEASYDRYARAAQQLNNAPKYQAGSDEPEFIVSAGKSGELKIDVSKILQPSDIARLLIRVRELGKEIAGDALYLPAFDTPTPEDHAVLSHLLERGRLSVFDASGIDKQFLTLLDLRRRLETILSA